MRTKILALSAVLVLAGLPLFAEGAAEGAAGERTTLTVELFDRGNMEGNSLTEGPITQYILENFAEPNNIDFQWKVLPRGEEESGLTLWMAAGDAPDLSFTYSWPLIFKFVQDGGVRPVDDLLEQHGQELAAWLGDAVLSRWGSTSPKPPTSSTRRCRPSSSRIRAIWVVTWCPWR